MRRFAAPGLVLGLIVALLFGVSASSEPVAGVRVPSVQAFNALDARVADLEQRVDALEGSAEPTPAPSPTQEPSPSPSPEPAPEPSPTPALGGFPDASNTGVPDGVTLTEYTGPCTIQADRTLNAVDARPCGALVVQAGAKLTITNSITPRLESTDDGNGGVNLGSIEVADSEVRAGEWSEGALWGYNITARRVEVTGGQHSFHCNDNCVVEDSWLHGQYNPDGESYHTNAFITNGGTGMVVRGNTLHCDSILNSTDGGCTADVSLFGDFDPVSDVLVEGNLFKANDSSISYCAYGGHQPSKAFPVATQIRYVDNVFERGTNGKCGVYGPVTSFDPSAEGNVWSGNVWDSGEPVNP